MGQLFSSDALGPVLAAALALPAAAVEYTVVKALPEALAEVEAATTSDSSVPF